MKMLFHTLKRLLRVRSMYQNVFFFTKACIRLKELDKSLFAFYCNFNIIQQNLQVKFKLKLIKATIILKISLFEKTKLSSIV